MRDNPAAADLSRWTFRQRDDFSGRTGISTSAGLIQDTNRHVADYPEIHVDGELMPIPYRMHYSWPDEDVTLHLTSDQRLVPACWMSRHHARRVRQRALALILASNVPWTAPFVVQLCGEDVIELGEEPIRKDTMAATQQSSAKPRTPRPRPRAQDSPT
ncbi:MAG TPA: hypothetical protein VLR70_03360 [Arthrobacter sp.]|nr:hypothetical protein [Arthrobacter sp.]